MEIDPHMIAEAVGAVFILLGGFILNGIRNSNTDLKDQVQRLDDRLRTMEIQVTAADVTKAELEKKIDLIFSELKSINEAVSNLRASGSGG
ncbi:MAG: hypothetical protein AAF098_13395 [Pseudomonadota bacterium]